MIVGFFILNACDMIFTYPDEVSDEEKKAAAKVADTKENIEEPEASVEEDPELIEEDLDLFLENGEELEYETIVVEDLSVARDELYTLVSDMEEDIEEYLAESYDLEKQLDETAGEDILEDTLDEIQITLNSAADDIEPYYLHVNSISDNEEYTYYYYDITGMRDVLDEYLASIDMDFAIVEDALVLLQADTDADGIDDYYDECDGYDDNIDEDSDGIPDDCDFAFDCSIDADCDDGNQSTKDECVGDECLWTWICLSSSDCDDDYDFTNDACIDGGCNNTLQLGKCYDSTDCDDADEATADSCISNECIYEPAHCSNSVKDEDEGDIDCGGAECVPCLEFDACNLASDCETDYCYSGVCEYECEDGGDEGQLITKQSTSTGYLYDDDVYGAYDEVCYTDTIVIEYYCENNRVMKLNSACDVGFNCTNGACV